MESGQLKTWAMVAAGVVASAAALYYLMDDGCNLSYGPKCKNSLDNLHLITEDLNLEYTCILIRTFQAEQKKKRAQPQAQGQQP